MSVVRVRAERLRWNRVAGGIFLVAGGLLGIAHVKSAQTSARAWAVCFNR